MKATKSRGPGWTDLLRREGPNFLGWLAAEGVLRTKFEAIADALRKMLYDCIRTRKHARNVWDAVPAVLSQCNDQATYALPGATAAYAWLHLLDRYARTWMALERLVVAQCLPMSRHGVRVLDVGTGPGPSAFAIHDFYVAMAAYAKQMRKPSWSQLPDLTCVELDPSSNHFRHRLAEEVAAQSREAARTVISLCSARDNFRAIWPTLERKVVRECLRREIDEYWDEVLCQWDGGYRYSPEEANAIAHSLHRYRLIVFSNFLTSVGTIAEFEPNLLDLLIDANAGTVLMVLGGKADPYPEIYQYVNKLASQAGFAKILSGILVSSADTDIADRVYEEGSKVFTRLERLSPSMGDVRPEITTIRSHFGTGREKPPSSQLWAYRKPR